MKSTSGKVRGAEGYIGNLDGPCTSGSTMICYVQGVPAKGQRCPRARGGFDLVEMSERQYGDGNIDSIEAIV